MRFDGAAWSAPYPHLAIFGGVFITENVHSGEVVEVDNRRNLYRVIIGELGEQGVSWPKKRRAACAAIAARPAGRHSALSPVRRCRGFTTRSAGWSSAPRSPKARRPGRPSALRDCAEHGASLAQPDLPPPPPEPTRHRRLARRHHARPYPRDDRQQIAHRPHIRLADRQAGRSSSRPRARGLRPCPMYPRRVRGVPGARPSHHGLPRDQRPPLARRPQGDRRRIGDLSRQPAQGEATRSSRRAAAASASLNPWRRVPRQRRTAPRVICRGRPKVSMGPPSRRVAGLSPRDPPPRPRWRRKVPERAQPAARA